MPLEEASDSKVMQGRYHMCQGLSTTEELGDKLCAADTMPLRVDLTLGRHRCCVSHV